MIPRESQIWEALHPPPLWQYTRICPVDFSCTESDGMLSSFRHGHLASQPFPVLTTPSRRASRSEVCSYTRRIPQHVGNVWAKNPQSETASHLVTMIFGDSSPDADGLPLQRVPKALLTYLADVANLNCLDGSLSCLLPLLGRVTVAGRRKPPFGRLSLASPVHRRIAHPISPFPRSLLMSPADKNTYAAFISSTPRFSDATISMASSGTFIFDARDARTRLS